MVEASSSYESLIAKSFETFLTQIKSDGWESKKKTATYELFLKEATPVNAVKVVGVFNASPAKIQEVIFDPKTLPKYDETKESREELESGPNYKVFYTRGTKIFMVDPRDTLIVIAYKVEADGTIIIAGCSVSHSKIPDEVKGRIRAQVDYMGYILEAVPGDANKCKLTYSGKLDPKGSVPGMIVNKMIMKQGEIMEKLGNYAAKL